MELPCPKYGNTIIMYYGITKEYHEITMVGFHKQILCVCVVLLPKTFTPLKYGITM